MGPAECFPGAMKMQAQRMSPMALLYQPTGESLQLGPATGAFVPSVISWKQILQHGVLLFEEGTHATTAQLC
jgi:hypothetical protein